MCHRANGSVGNLTSVPPARVRKASRSDQSSSNAKRLASGSLTHTFAGGAVRHIWDNSLETGGVTWSSVKGSTGAGRHTSRLQLAFGPLLVTEECYSYRRQKHGTLGRSNTFTI